MSLNWDVSNVENFKEKKGPVLDSLIWLTMEIGIPEFTEKNVDQVYARTHAVESVLGSYMRQHDEETGKTTDRPFTKEDIRNYIGLCTNASSLTVAGFKKRMVSRIALNHLGKAW